MKIALLQHAAAPSRDENLATAERLIRDAASNGASLVVTPELFTARYFPQTETDEHFALAEPIPGHTTNRLCKLADELNVSISASLFEKRAPGVFHNTSVMIQPRQGITATYRKMHIPDDPRFYEKFYFTPGDTGFTTADVAGVRAGMLVCWDQWFPEAARLTAMRGAHVLLYPTAIAWCNDELPEEQQRQRDAWITMQRSHAIANGVFVAAVNRVGVEGDIHFYGSSFVADPSGKVIAQANESDPELLVVDCDLSKIEPQRRAWPFLRDRRIDAYSDLTRRYIDE